MSRTRVASINLLLLAAACGTSEPTAAPLAPTVDRAILQAQPVRVPKPRLVLDSATAFFGSNYDLSVANWAKFPDELFAASPSLPPCGLNTSASRSWVDVIDSNGAVLNSFCAFGSAADLAGVWVYAPQLPISVHIVISDRLTNTTYKSNAVRIPAP